MRRRGEAPPSEFFPYVVGAALGLEFDFVLGVGLDAAKDFLASRNDEDVIAAGTDSRSVLAACDRGAKSGAGIAVGPIYIDHGGARWRRRFFKRLPLHGASDRGRADHAEDEQLQTAIHWLEDAVGDLPALAAACAR